MDDDKKFDDIKAELRTRFELLPEDLQNVIKSSDYQTTLFEIAKKNKWTYEQLGDLEIETTMVLLGMTNPNDYALELANQLGKKPAEVTSIVAEIKTRVFDPIRNSLMKLYTEEEAAAPVPSPIQPITGVVPPQPKAPQTSDSDKAVLEKSGITIEETKPVAPAASEKRGDLLSGIENPPKSAPKILNQVPAPTAVPKAPYATGNMVASKLSSTVAIPPKATDYSIPKMGTTTPPPPPKAPGSDPYKEPLE